MVEKPGTKKPYHWYTAAVTEDGYYITNENLAIISNSGLLGKKIIREIEKFTINKRPREK